MLKRPLSLMAAALPALVAVTLAAAPARAAAPAYPAIYVFGDSLSDAGNDWIATKHAEPISPPYSPGRFSNGSVWAQDLVIALGMPPLKAFLAGGTDFADGGAESGATMVHPLGVIDIPAQILEFKARVPTPVKGALYVFWVGANDLFSILGHTPALTTAQTAKTIQQIVTNEVAEIAALAALGAKDLLVLTAPDLGKVPAVASLGVAASAAGSALSFSYNAALSAAVTKEAKLLGLKLTLVDAFAPMDAWVADPKKFGFTDVTHPCWTGSYTSARSGTLCATTIKLQDEHLFWDMVHPTARGHALISLTVEAALE